MPRDDESVDEMPPDWLPTLLDYYENDEAAEWLTRPHEMLGGEVPLDLVRAGRQEEVADLIEMLDRGAAV